MILWSYLLRNNHLDIGKLAIGVILGNLADSQASCIKNPDVLEAVIHDLACSDYPELALLIISRTSHR
jgi:hypothetical protein